MNQSHFDVFIVGGGINGTGIAADAAGRNLSVGLCEMGDLAQATSSSSSKLIHGGLRYLEHYEFRLVKEALAEREVLLKTAPHLVTPMRFQMPHRPHLRPAWLIRIGLFLYDNLSKRETLQASKGIKYGTTSPLKEDITQGFEYSDCWVDDARLVVTNALSAKNNGAEIYARTRCVSAKRINKQWHIELENVLTKQAKTVTANALVNAAGPWVSSFIETKLEKKAPYGIRMIKGSHLAVPKLYQENNAFIMQNTDKRIVFAIPYQDNYTLLGTTDVEYKGDASQVSISDEEVSYILQVTNDHFQKALSPEDVVWSYSGVRPLLEDESSDPSAVTRDYTLHLEGAQDEAPLLSIFGGKITTYRKLALSAMEKLAPFFEQQGPAWTHEKPLPGGDFKQTLTDFTRQLQKQYAFLPSDLMQRLARNYGSLTHRLLANIQSEDELGQHFGANLYQLEVDYLIEHEWAHTAEDILWRRSKLGLEFSDQQTTKLNSYIQSR